METLDKCFENVCELDLIFHMDKVCKKKAIIYRILHVKFKVHVQYNPVNTTTFGP